MSKSEQDYRERCLQAKGEDCGICGDPEDVVHHIDGDRLNGDLDNLIPLCHSCHAVVHRSVGPVSGGIGALKEQLSDHTSTPERRRAILTDREREMLQAPREDRDDPHYVVISQVRTKIQEELDEDLEILRENHEELFNELQEVVCDDAE